MGKPRCAETTPTRCGVDRVGKESIAVWGLLGLDHAESRGAAHGELEPEREEPLPGLRGRAAAGLSPWTLDQPAPRLRRLARQATLFHRLGARPRAPRTLRGRR